MKIKRIMAGMLAAITVLGSLAAPMSVKADQIDAPYLALGEDLNETCLLYTSPSPRDS